MTYLWAGITAAGLAMQVGSMFTKDQGTKQGLSMGGGLMSLGGGMGGGFSGLMGGAGGATGGAASGGGGAPGAGAIMNILGMGQADPTAGPMAPPAINGGPPMPPGMGPAPTPEPVAAPAVNPAMLRAAMPDEVKPISGPTPWERAAQTSMQVLAATGGMGNNNRTSSPQVHMQPIATGAKSASLVSRGGAPGGSPIERYLAMLRR